MCRLLRALTHEGNWNRFVLHCMEMPSSFFQIMRGKLGIEGTILHAPKNFVGGGTKCIFTFQD